jgi:hypothetical protein
MGSRQLSCQCSDSARFELEKCEKHFLMRMESQPLYFFLIFMLAMLVVTVADDVEAI